MSHATKQTEVRGGIRLDCTTNRKGIVTFRSEGSRLKRHASRLVCSLDMHGTLIYISRYYESIRLTFEFLTRIEPSHFN